MGTRIYEEVLNMSRSISVLQKARARYEPKLPAVLTGNLAELEIQEGQVVSSPDPEIEGHFPLTSGRPVVTFHTGGSSSRGKPLRVGVVLSGGQAPGGHNVIAGLYDGLTGIDRGSRLFGFTAGPGGILRNEYVELTGDVIAPYRNAGGFDIIGSGRDKIEDEEQLRTSLRTCNELKLDGLVDRA